MRVVVVGGGTVGLAAAASLAVRGHDVTVLERFEHVHGMGSHGGFTRIIRQAYHEGTGYVEIVRAAEEAWLALEGGAPGSLLVRTGLLELGPPDDPEFRAAIDACVSCGVEHEMVSPAAARDRWPFRIPDDFEVCFTPSGGYLLVQRCLDALRDRAREHGATFRYGARVQEVDPDRGAVVLEGGEVVQGDTVVVAAGAYTHKLVPDFLPGRLVALRRALVWKRPDESHRAALSALPVWGAFVPDGFFYGFPWNREGIDGFKMACHTSRTQTDLGVPVDPDTVDRELRPTDLEPLEGFLGTYLPEALGQPVEHRICLYGVTPSWDFVLDHHPNHPKVVVAAGFSGHGFKFAPVLGDIAADLVEHRAPRWERAAFGHATHVGGPRFQEIVTD